MSTPSIDEENGLDEENSRPCPRCYARVPNPDLREMPVEDDCWNCAANLRWEYDYDDEGQLYFWLTTADSNVNPRELTAEERQSIADQLGPGTVTVEDGQFVFRREGEGPAEEAPDGRSVPGI